MRVWHATIAHQHRVRSGTRADQRTGPLSRPSHSRLTPSYRPAPTIRLDAHSVPKPALSGCSKGAWTESAITSFARRSSVLGKPRSSLGRQREDGPGCYHYAAEREFARTGVL